MDPGEADCGSADFPLADPGFQAGVVADYPAVRHPVAGHHPVADCPVAGCLAACFPVGSSLVVTPLVVVVVPVDPVTAGPCVVVAVGVSSCLPFPAFEDLSVLQGPQIPVLPP